MVNLLLQALRLHRSTLGLDEEAKHRIAAVAQLRDVPAGDHLHHEAELVSSLQLIVNGQVALTLKGADRREQTIRCLNPGDQFGLLGILHEMPAPIGAVAVTDCRIVSIPATDARLLLEDLPLWKRRLLGSLGVWQPATAGRRRTIPRIVGMLRASNAVLPLIRSLSRHLVELGESVAILTDSPAEFGGAATQVQSIFGDDQQLLQAEEVREQVIAARTHDRVLLCFDVHTAPAYLFPICEGCERVYWFSHPEDADTIETCITDVVTEDSSLASHFRWVWCLTDQHAVAPLRPALTSLMSRDIKLLLSAGDAPRSRLELRGFQQLVHDLRNVRLGITLSGGAARGMAHLGVLLAIEEAGIVPDLISGTSVGAMVGVIYAAGIPPADAAESFARDLTPGFLEQKLPGGGLFYLWRKYRRRHWDAMLRPYLHDWKLQQLQTPTSTVSVDLVSGKQHVQQQGDAVQSILDSINLPGLSPPICRDGMALVDGGVLNNLPADVLISQGADFVVAVDVGSHLPEEFSGIRADTPTNAMPLPNLLETLTRAFTVQSNQMNALGAQPADFRIDPDVSDFSPGDFHRAVELAENGQETAERILSDLRATLKKIDASLTAID